MIVGVAAKRGREIEKMEKPNRHNHLITYLVKELGWDIPIRVEEQGFYDDQGLFYNREAAYKHAELNKQFIQSPIHPGELFSEDVW